MATQAIGNSTSLSASERKSRYSGDPVFHPTSQNKQVGDFGAYVVSAPVKPDWDDFIFAKIFLNRVFRNGYTRTQVKHMRILCLLFCLVSFLFAAFVAPAETKVERKGYVTALNPPSGFRLGQQEIRVDQHTKVYELVMWDSNPSTPFAFRLVPPCTYIAVKGVENSQTHSILAKTIDLMDDKSLCKVSGTGMEDKAPSLKKEGPIWNGKIYVDGYELIVDAGTKVVLSAASDVNAFHPQLRIEYAAERQPDGSLHATNLTFAQNTEVAEQKNYRDGHDFKIDLPDYDKKVPGKVHGLLWSAGILPDRQLQDAISALGEKLVPQWQKELADSDPAKIHFRLFVIKQNKTIKTTTSSPSGTVLVPVNVLLRLKNEAQLLSLLSADISGVVLENGYYSHTQAHVQQAIDIGLLAAPYGSSFLGMILNDRSFSAKYWVPMMERDYRVGMQLVLAAGYDPREMPVAVQRLCAKHPDTPKAEQTSAFPAYLDAVVGFHSGDTDFSDLRTGETEYTSLLDMARTSEAAKTGKTRLSDND